jgi:hypothetical protein
MRRFFIVSAVAISCFPSTLALGAGLDAGAYVNQVSGLTGKAMSMEDVISPIKSLAANLPHMSAGQSNYSFVLQNGDFNNGVLVQSGLGNAALVVQSGYNNSAYMQQFGRSQGFIIQNGTGNFASVTQR